MEDTNEIASEFIQLLDEIECCRMRGFIRPALYMALSVIDSCASVAYPEYSIQETYKRYAKWIKEFLYDDELAYKYYYYYICNNSTDGIINIRPLKDAPDKIADEIYSLRCNLFHSSNIEITSDSQKRFVNISRVYVITPNSESEYGCGQLYISHWEHGYKPVDIGCLLIQIYKKAKEYYLTADAEIQKKLNAINEYVVDERNENWREKYYELTDLRQLNKRVHRNDNKQE